LSAYYSQGRGVEKDLTKAYFWSLVAQANGDQFSKERVAFLASQLSTEQAAAVKADADHWIKEHLD
jgi:TPR repeat protein